MCQVRLAFHTHTHTFPITSQNCCQYNKCKSPRQTQRAAAVELRGTSYEKERERERLPRAHGAPVYWHFTLCLLVYALWKKNSETKAVYLYCTCQNTDLSVVDGRALLDRCVQWQKEGRGLDLCLRKFWTMSNKSYVWRSFDKIAVQTQPYEACLS